MGGGHARCSSGPSETEAGRGEARGAIQGDGSPLLCCQVFLPSGIAEDLGGAGTAGRRLMVGWADWWGGAEGAPSQQLLILTVVATLPGDGEADPPIRPCSLPIRNIPSPPPPLPPQSDQRNSS